MQDAKGGQDARVGRIDLADFAMGLMVILLGAYLSTIAVQILIR